jgi:hypothetical protein
MAETRISVKQQVKQQVMECRHSVMILAWSLPLNYQRIAIFVGQIIWSPFSLQTNSIEQSPFWETNRSSASQEVPHILWNPKVHSRIHKLPPPAPILSQRISPSPKPCLFRNSVSFYGEELLVPLPPKGWTTTRCRLSAIAYSMYSQLPSIYPTSLPGGRSMPGWQGPTYRFLYRFCIIRVIYLFIIFLHFCWRCMRKIT